MGFRARMIVVAVVAGSVALAGAGSAHAAEAAGPSGGAFTLTTKTAAASSGYAPTFTGNGLLGVRVPAAGQGYAGGTVPAQSELAGFYAKPSKGKASERVQQRANIPTWSTLTFSDGGHAFSPTTGKVSGYRQSIDLRTGIITTRARWTAPDGHVTNLMFQVLTDRAREHVGLVRLTVRPQWSGTATVTDELDGTADTNVPKGTPVLTRPISKAWIPQARTDTVTIAALGTGIQATEVSQLAPSANVTAPSTPIDAHKPQSVGQRVRFAVVKGHTYTFTKFVAVQDDAQPPNGERAAVSRTRATVTSAATLGWQGLLASNRAAWAALWRGRIDVAGDRTLATDVNASEFYLWSSTRSDQDWSVSPAGLSSNGYDGHIFWDAETWMFPSLLAQHPGLARAMEAYRFQRLPEARRHARQTGWKGARFPWESALDGTEQIPPPPSINSEGLYEQHITADIALAQWQYWLATHNRSWLAGRGWPVLSGAAAFWASRATRNRTHPPGGYWFTHVTGPDEENPNVNGEVYTQVAARATPLDATAAARVLHGHAPKRWAKIAHGLRVPVKHGINPEFHGYRGQLVKQADVTLLGYPWGFRSSAAIERADLAFYVPRTDPGGPSMSDAVNSIESVGLDPRGCQAFVYTERSYQPFIRDVFHQFSETRTGGAFTFMTGIGGFLQEFVYGYSGLRWQGSAVHLAPGLSGPITGVTLHDLHWRGRVFTVVVHRGAATVTLQRGAPMPVVGPSSRAIVRAGHSARIPTLRPTGARSNDPLLCGDARASHAAPGAPALAAVDGSAATDWQPTKLPATVSAPLRQARRISTITVRWGRAWPTVLKPNVHPKPRPVQTLRSRDYVVQVRSDARGWRTVARVRSHSARLTDTIRVPAGRARAVRLRLIGGTGKRTVKTSSAPSTPILPMVQELTAR
ncbi:MAG TPA: glycosyl hydrolase family 65 protein [Solirubrobacteraceae bacterium]|nr:glycosyl hydrolase family 65 protein [Solirubrobacteraceae bacterium]